MARSASETGRVGAMRHRPTVLHPPTPSPSLQGGEKDCTFPPALGERGGSLGRVAPARRGGLRHRKRCLGVGPQDTAPHCQPRAPGQCWCFWLSNRGRHDGGTATDRPLPPAGGGPERWPQRRGRQTQIHLLENRRRRRRLGLWLHIKTSLRNRPPKICDRLGSDDQANEKECRQSRDIRGCTAGKVSGPVADGVCEAGVGGE